MRITNNVIFGNTTRYISQNQSEYLKLEEALLTGRRINRPSDDPVGSARSLNVKKTLSALAQLERNLSQAEGFIEQTDLALGNVVDRLLRAIELTTAINGGISGADEYASAATELDGIITEVIRNANMKYGDRYIFSGYSTQTQPFDDLGVYSGGLTGEEIDMEIADGQYLTVNMTGDYTFQGGVDVIQTLIDTRDAIASGDQTAIANQLPLLNNALNQILNRQAENGTKSNRIDIAVDDAAALEEAATAILSDVEDVDTVEYSTRFAQQEQALQAAMLVSSRVLSQNFLDFLV